MSANPHAWNLTDLKNIKSNGVRVMSTFACGGGSSMGYKLAGCEIVAANDIDPQMAQHYKRNLNPPRYYLCPIRDLLTSDLPDELFNLDILDGSPPCSTFSTAGSREKSWGKNKHFREGQAKQVLSDLFFDYLDLVERLKPKVAIAENVKGMILGNAKGYTKQVMARFREMSYRPQLFLLNAADCGVPQRRERVFFCAVRNDVSADCLKLSPSAGQITAAAATADICKSHSPRRLSTKTETLWRHTRPGECLSSGNVRMGNKPSRFGESKLCPNKVSPTLTTSSFYHWDQPRHLSFDEFKRLGSFPDDYYAESERIGKYMIGMSVPPRMAETVARAVCEQWLRVS